MNASLFAFNQFIGSFGIRNGPYDLVPSVFQHHRDHCLRKIMCHDLHTL